MAELANLDLASQIAPYVKSKEDIVPALSLDYDLAIRAGLKRYSIRRPRWTSQDLASDGSGEFNTANLTSFDEQITSMWQKNFVVEYPIQTSGLPTALNRGEWIFYRKPTGLVVRTLTVIPSGENVRFLYPAVHTYSKLVTTVPASDIDALVKLCAAELCDAVARHYSSTSEREMMNVDISFFDNKATKWRDRAEDLRKDAFPLGPLRVA